MTLFELVLGKVSEEDKAEYTARNKLAAAWKNSQAGISAFKEYQERRSEELQ